MSRELHRHLGQLRANKNNSPKPLANISPLEILAYRTVYDGNWHKTGDQKYAIKIKTKIEGDDLALLKGKITNAIMSVRNGSQPETTLQIGTINFQVENGSLIANISKETMQSIESARINNFLTY